MLSLDWRSSQVSLDIPILHSHHLFFVFLHFEPLVFLLLLISIQDLCRRNSQSPLGRVWNILLNFVAQSNSWARTVMVVPLLNLKYVFLLDLKRWILRCIFGVLYLIIFFWLHQDLLENIYSIIIHRHLSKLLFHRFLKGSQFWFQFFERGTFCVRLFTLCRILIDLVDLQLRLLLIIGLLLLKHFLIFQFLSFFFLDDYNHRCYLIL